jgi:hypothetical protein
MSIFKATGKYVFDVPNVTRKHEKQASWKKFAMIEFGCEMDAYYRWLLERRFSVKLNRPLRGPHVTIINDRESDMIPGAWEQMAQKYHGTEVDIYLCSDLRTDGSHWWLRAGGDGLWLPRMELGLDHPYWSFHMSIGYANERNIEHSEYILKTIQFHGTARKYTKTN